MSFDLPAPQAAPQAALTVVIHLPERRKRAQSVVLCHGCCCCCCCCCLHSVGGILGAAIGSLPTKEPITDRRQVSASLLYWLWFGAGTVAAITLALVLGRHKPEASMWGLIAVAMLLPGVQIGASILSLLCLLLSNPDDRGARLASIGRITLYSFLGTVIGLFLMLIGGVMLAAVSR